MRTKTATKRDAAPRLPADARSRWLIPVAAAGVFVLALLAHGRSMQGEFLWDDEYFIRSNPVIDDQRQPWGYWTDTRLRDYCPLTLTFFHWQTEFLGGRTSADAFTPIPYRAVNVLLHATACLVLFLVLRQLCVPWAWFGAAFFAVHPVTVASVGWISEQKNTLSLLFCALAMLAFLRFEASGRWWLYALAAAAFAASLLSKSSTLVLPAMLLVVLWWRRRPLREVRILLALGGLFLLAGAAAVWTLWFQGHNAVKGTPLYGPQGAWQHLLTASKVIWFYAGKALAPVRLNMNYPKWNPAAIDWTVAAIPGLAAWAGILLACRRRAWARTAAAASACFVLALAPVLCLVDMSFMEFSFVSDHLMYVALTVAAAAAAGILAHLARRGRAARIGAWAAGFAILAVLAAATAARANIFTSNYALWRDTVAKNPASWLGHGNIADVYRQAHHDPRAVKEYDLAIKLCPPRRAVGHRYFEATVLARMGKLPEACEVLEACDWTKATGSQYKAPARLLFASVLQQRQQYDRARENYEAVLAEAGNDLPAIDRAATLNNLADLLMEHSVQPPAKALEYARHAVELLPNNPDFLDTLGWAYFRTGQLDTSQQQLARAVGIRPAGPCCYHLGMVLEARGQKAEALRMYRLGLEMLGPKTADEYYARIKERLDALKG